MALDLANVTPEEIAALRAHLGLGDAPQRTPVFKPLRDLRPQTTAKGRLSRPHFELNTEEPPEGVFIPPFPRLYWNPQGKEVRVESAEHMQQVGVGVGWTDAPPMGNEMTAEDRMKAEIAMLSPEDREFLLNSVKEARMASLKERMAGLSNEDIAALMPAKPKAVEKSKSA